MKSAVRRIYEKKFNPLTEIDEGIFNETWNIFNQATDEGFGQREYSDPDYNFYQELRYNNAVFSAFRTHRMQNDIAAQLLDGDGKLKSFEKFAADVAPITDHNVKHWLRTEYDTAILRAHQAADWKQFQEVKDILPNLRWMPTTSVTPDAVHRVYWQAELTLPQNHPFWNLHRPGDRWNCKCSLEATDDPERGAHVIEDENQPEPDRGLDNNPGEDGMLFSFSHPFFTAGYLTYKKLAPIVNRFVDKQLTKAAAKNLKSVRAKLPTHNGLRIKSDDFTSGSLIILRRTLDDVLEHNINDKWMKLWLSTFDPEKSIRNWKYEGWAKSRINPVTGKSKHPETDYFTYYSFKLKGKTYWANVKVHRLMKGEVLYTIEKNKPADIIPGKRI